MGIGQPSVHGELALVPKPITINAKARRMSVGFELVGIRQHARQTRLVGVGNHVGGVGVDQQRTEQGSYAGGADHRILPRSLEGRFVLVDAHEEHGGKRGCLHWWPT